ncbi:MAG TPA: glucodextranase DOMON-like domain-containing protein [Meiothermus sp.]|nr:glucodextranase DOMON-like domain-containing protein [Meiothermus sp.]
MIPLLFTDPLGDDHGLGYVYPEASIYAESGFADLTGFQALERDGQLVLRVRLARYPNPQAAPLGFSLAIVGIYVESEPAANEPKDGQELPGAGFKTPAGQGWNEAYLVNGWKAESLRPDGSRREVQARKEGDWLEVFPDLPPGDYGYYVTVGLYDPFTSSGFRPVRPGGGTWVLDAPGGAPTAVDVLSDHQAQAYQSGVLAPVRAVSSPLPWAIGVAVAGFLAIVLAFVFPRRRRPRAGKAGAGGGSRKPQPTPRGAKKPAAKEDDFDIDIRF